VNWLYNAHLVIGGHSITYREIAGNLLGLISAIGGMRRQVWAWPIGIVGNVFLFTVFMGNAFGQSAQAPLLGQAGRQVFFAVTSVYGWYRWSQTRRSGSNSPAVVPRWATSRERLACLALAAVGVAACYFIFRAIGAGFPVTHWWYYPADAWIFVGSMVATYAMARGWIDFWLCWIAVDCVGVPELLYSKLYPSAAMFVVYGAFVIWGFAVWLKVSREERLPSGLSPLQEAVS